MVSILCLALATNWPWLPTQSFLMNLASKARFVLVHFDRVRFGLGCLGLSPLTSRWLTFSFKCQKSFPHSKLFFHCIKNHDGIMNLKLKDEIQVFYMILKINRGRLFVTVFYEWISVEKILTSPSALYRNLSLEPWN